MRTVIRDPPQTRSASRRNTNVCSYQLSCHKRGSPTIPRPQGKGRQSSVKHVGAHVCKRPSCCPSSVCSGWNHFTPGLLIKECSHSHVVASAVAPREKPLWQWLVWLKGNRDEWLFRFWVEPALHDGRCGRRGTALRPFHSP